MQKKFADISRYYPLFFTVLFIFILAQYSFSTLEAILYDLRIKYDFGPSFRNDIVLVAIDEESDEFLGERYPYTYATHLRFSQKLFKDKPAIVNYFVSLLPPQTPIEKNYLKQLFDEVEKFKSVKGYFRFGTDLDPLGEQLPPDELADLGYSLALLNIDNTSFSRDDITRKSILNIEGDDSLHLWTANKYREITGKKRLEATDILGSFYVREADATFVRFRFYEDPRDNKSRITVVPFHRVVVGNYPTGFFKDKIVLVGTKYISKPGDFILTPYNREEYKASKLNIHAQIIQSLVQNKTVYEVPRIITNILSLILAIALSLIIAKVQPTKGLVITISTLVGVVLFAYLIFSLFGLWIYLSHLVLSIFAVYYIWVPFKAIAEYKRRYAIQEEAKILKQVDHLKQNFISLMSHDLKTPVAKIAGIAEILSTQFPNSLEQKSNITSIIEATKELNKFITSILDLTKIESRNLTLRKISKDLNQIVETVVEALRFEASLKSITIETQLSPLYPISMDVDLMKRVLSNLVENAIKYSADETHILIKTWDDEKWVYLEITDSGIGIAPENLEHIFEKFYRVRNDAVHRIKGSGLGLYLVRYFVELHEGKISVKSTLGKGTTFLVQFKNA